MTTATQPIIQNEAPDQALPRPSVAQRATSFSSAAINLAATVALLGGVPYLLIRFVGNPFPATLPNLDKMSWYLNNGQVPDRFWVGLFAVIVWCLWAQLVVGFAVELRATIGGWESPQIRGFGLAQSLVGPLVTRIAMTVSVIGATPGLAGAVAALPASTTVEAAPDVSYATARGAVPSFAEFVQVDDSLAPAPIVEQATVTIVVGRRDTFRSLAADHLDSAARWSEIRGANLGHTMVDGTVIDEATVSVSPGWTLRMPTSDDDGGGDESGPVDSAGTESGDGSGEVEVVDGDHFWSLAKETLTDVWGREPTDAELTPYWFEMVEANSGNLLPPGDPNLIYPGQQFVIPTPSADPTLGPLSDFSAREELTPRVVQDTPLSAEQEHTPAPEPVAAPAPVVIEQAKAGDEAGSSAIAVDWDNVGSKALLVGVSAMVIGLLRLTLVKLRRRRATRRTAGQAIDLDTIAAKVEDQIRAIEVDGADGRYLAAFNPWLTHTLKDAPAMPAISAVRAGSTGLEVLLAEPCEMPEHWVQIADNAKAWRLHSNITDRIMESEAGSAFDYCPALLPVGNSPAGEVFLDTEQFKVIAIQGPEEQRAGLLRSMIVGALALPWAEHCNLVAIGVNGLGEASGSRVFTPKDPQAWAERQVDLATRNTTGSAMSTYERRVNSTVEQYPTLVFVGSGFAGVAQHLCAATQSKDASIVLVAASELAVETTIMVDSTHATLEPSGLRWELRPADPEDLFAVDLVIADANQPLPEVLTEAAPIAETRAEALPAPTESAVGQITEILEPKDFEVRVLLDQPLVRHTVADPGSITEKHQAVIAYIVLHPQSTPDKIRNEFWGPNPGRGATNSLGAINRLLGETSEGEQRFTRTSTAYEMVDVGCDWHRFQALVILADGSDSLGDQAAFLDAALGLVEGVPSTRTRTLLWGWLTEDPRWYHEFDRVVVESAERRAMIGINSGDIVSALKAVQQGRMASPHAEVLVRVAMNANAVINPRASEQEYIRAVSRAELDGIELAAATHATYSAIRVSSTGVSH